MSLSPLDAALSLLIVALRAWATEALSGVKVEVGVTLMSDFRPPPCSPCWNLAVLAPGVMVNTYLINGGVENYP